MYKIKKSSDTFIRWFGGKHERKWLSGYGIALASAALVVFITVLNKWLLAESVPALTAGA